MRTVTVAAVLLVAVLVVAVVRVNHGEPDAHQRTIGHFMGAMQYLDRGEVPQARAALKHYLQVAPNGDTVDWAKIILKILPAEAPRVPGGVARPQRESNGPG